MLASRKNRVNRSLVVLFLLSACATSSYRVVNVDGFRTELLVTPDRISLECEDIKDHEDVGSPEGNFGFMIHVLDEENTVLTLIQGPVTTRRFCLEQQKAIEKVLKNGKIIYIAGHGSLDEPRKMGKTTYSSFPKPGVFRGNGRVLMYAVIRNEHGQYYSKDNGSKEPCMPPEFPIKNPPGR
jgi:hypothetical protein